MTKTRLNVYLLMKNMVSCLTKKGILVTGKNYCAWCDRQYCRIQNRKSDEYADKTSRRRTCFDDSKATNFINPITFETLTNHKCLVDTFDRNFNYNIEHVSLGNKADLVLVAAGKCE